MYIFTGQRELFIVSVSTFGTFARERGSARSDADKIRGSLTRLNFQCPDENQLIGHVTLTQAQDAIGRLVEGHRQDRSDMIALCIMTHGTYERHGQLLQFSDNQFITLSELIAPVLECASLVGRPKLLFIQACRGTFCNDQGMTPDNPVFCHNTNRVYHSTRDKFIFYSSSPGNFSWCHPNRGSLFIDHLARALNVYGRTIDLAALANRVCEAMTEEDEFTFDIDGQRQRVVLAPVVEHCLRYKVVFDQVVRDNVSVNTIRTYTEYKPLLTNVLSKCVMVYTCCIVWILFIPLLEVLVGYLLQGYDWTTIQARLVFVIVNLETMIFAGMTDFLVTLFYIPDRIAEINKLTKSKDIILISSVWVLYVRDSKPTVYPDGFTVSSALIPDLGFDTSLIWSLFYWLLTTIFIFIYFHKYYGRRSDICHIIVFILLITVPFSQSDVSIYGGYFMNFLTNILGWGWALILLVGVMKIAVPGLINNYIY